MPSVSVQKSMAPFWLPSLFLLLSGGGKGVPSVSVPKFDGTLLVLSFVLLLSGGRKRVPPDSVQELVALSVLLLGFPGLPWIFIDFHEFDTLFLEKSVFSCIYRNSCHFDLGFRSICVILSNYSVLSHVYNRYFLGIH